MARSSVESPSLMGAETVVGYPDKPAVIKPVRFHHIANFSSYMARRSRVELKRRTTVSSRPQPVGR